MQAQVIRGTKSYPLEKQAISSVAYEANEIMENLLEKMANHDPVYPALVMNPFLKVSETPRVP